MYIVGVNGSPNKNGNTVTLLNTVLNECKKYDADTEIINVGAVLATSKTPYCVSCTTPCNGNCYNGTALGEAYEKLVKADAIVFASPVYFGTMSAQLKAFFDKARAYRGKKSFLGKPAAFLSCGCTMYGGEETTLTAMQTCALVYGMSVVGNSDFEYGAGHLGVGATSPVTEDKIALDKCITLAHRLLNEVQK